MFCIGQCALLTVVIVVTVVQSLVDRAPLVFLRLAENGVGQMDMEIKAASATYPLLNYTAFARAAQAASVRTDDDFTVTSPRIELTAQVFTAAACAVPVSLENASALYSTENGEACELSSLTAGDQPVQLSCVDSLCGASSTVRFIGADLPAELAAGVGRTFDRPTPAPGHALVSAGIAADRGLQQGDVLVLAVLAPVSLRHMCGPLTPASALAQGTGANASAAQVSDDFLLKPTLADGGWALAAYTHPDLAIPLVVDEVVTDWGGKFASGTNDVVMVNVHDMPTLFAAYAHPAIANTSLRAAVAAPAGQAAASVLPTGQADWSAGVLPATHTSMDANGTLQWSTARADSPASWYATQILANLPVGPRFAAYTDSNYDTLQAALTGYSSRLAYAVGFTQLSASLPLLEDLQTRQFFGLYLGLLMNILLLILFALSTVLVYSLLQVNISTRTFELAVRRMLGTSRQGILALLVVQAASYALPAWVLGLTISALLAIPLQQNFASVAGVPDDVSLSGTAVALGTLMALGSPTVAAVGPIMSALRKTIRDSLDTDRPKAVTVAVQIRRTVDQVNSGIIVGGLLATVVGFSIYYLLPLSLLSLNLAMFFNVFFGIFLLMLAGLILLALNVEHLLERAVSVVLLRWWERPAIVHLAVTNLIAHRPRNRKTTLMFALALALIVFVTVAANQEVAAVRTSAEQQAGSILRVEPGAAPSSLAASEVPTPAKSAWLLPYAQIGRELQAALDEQLQLGTITAYGWQTPQLETLADDDVDRDHLGNLARTQDANADVYGVSPAGLHVGLEEYWAVGSADRDWTQPGGSDYASIEDPTPDWAPRAARAATQAAGGLEPDVALYTVAGSQGLLGSTSNTLDTQLGWSVGGDVLVTADRTSTASSSTSASGTFQLASSSGSSTAGEIRDRLWLQTALDRAPGYRMRKYPGNAPSVVLSIPTWLSLLQERMSGVQPEPPNLPVKALRLSTVEGKEDEVKAALAAALAKHPGGKSWQVKDIRDEIDDIQTTIDVLNMFFSVLTVVSMGLCFFALSAGMATNIAEQQREIGVLRSIGARASMLVRVYVYEAFVLVVSAACMGIAIGTACAWTFATQRSLFTSLPLTLQFPYSTVIAVLLASIVCAAAASCGPAKRFASQPITQLLRSAGG